MTESNMKKWTAQQSEAIRAQGCNLLVAAAAGAGKTAVLVERIINIVKREDRPVDIDRLLVITYTNAAAAEMRERIASAISAAPAGGRERGRLELQASLINRAKITTIHSFCMDILRQYFYKLDLDPGFRVADETESGLLKNDVVEDLFEQMYAESGQSGAFTRLVECYGGDPGDAGLQELVIKVHDFSRSNPHPELWLEKIAGKLSSPEGLEEALEGYAAEVLAGVSASLAGAVENLEAALALCRRPGGPSGYQSGLTAEIAMLRELYSACRKGWKEAFQGFGAMEFTRLKSAGAGVDEELKKRAGELRDSAKAKVRKLKEEYLGRQLEEHRADLEKLAPLVGALADLVLRFGRSYRAAKLARGLVDFADLEHYCLQILSGGLEGSSIIPSDVALELRQRFEEVLVDEYQDINHVQEAIINLVSRQDGPVSNLFMVGDVKQSIYRFRLADPGLFLEKYRAYPAESGGAGRKINLASNFRSRPEVIDAVNYVFRLIMSGDTAEMDYDRAAELVCGSQVYSGRGGSGSQHRVELFLLDRGFHGGDAEEEPVPEDGGEDGYAGEEELAPAQAEARLIAGRIREMMGQGLPVYDGGLKGFRPVTYRDMVILMRATRQVAGVFVDQLNSCGIPAYADTGTGYYESSEIETILSLLKIIDNPRQDIPLAAVLRSPVVGLGAEELARVRMAAKQGDLWEAVESASLREDGDLPERLRRFTASLERWREEGRRAPLTDLIWTLYRETGYYYHVGAMPGGPQRQANLRSLHDRAAQYEATTFRGIFSFLRYIERLREKGEDSGRARTLGENENVVRIMSIHKSKGLEFPVVFLAGLGRRFNMRDLNGEILLHRDMGFGPALVDTAARVSYPTLARLAVRERLRREALAEEMRVLYVAMTRAREKLVLTGCVRNPGKYAGLFPGGKSGGIPLSSIAGASCYMDWLGCVLALHSDGGPLRELSGFSAGEGEGLAVDSSWLVSISGFGEKSGASGPGRDDGPKHRFAELIRRGERVDSPGTYAGAVDHRLSWEYPHREAAGKPAKVSVTGLDETACARASVTEDHWAAGPGGEVDVISSLKPIYARPAFIAGERDLTPAEKGTALHMVMRHLDLGGRLDAVSIAGQVARLVTRELITPEQALAVDCRRIEQFFKSHPGRRLLGALSVKREVPFGLLVPAEEVYPQLAGKHAGERVLVQGVIDCLAEEREGFIIIDYKTDRPTAREGDLPLKYAGQVSMYARAVEAISGRPVLACYLYFIRWGRYVTL